MVTPAWNELLLQAKPSRAVSAASLFIYSPIPLITLREAGQPQGWVGPLLLSLLSAKEDRLEVAVAQSTPQPLPAF